MINKFNMKKALTSVLALVLLVGCVLAFIPSEVLATWSVPDATSKTQGVNNAQGAYKVNFRYFANDLYVPAEEGSVAEYYFYKYDPNAASTNYVTEGATALNEGSPSTSSVLSDLTGLDTYLSSDVSIVSQNSNKLTVSGSGSNTKCSDIGCSHCSGNTNNSVSMAYSGYNVSFKILNGKEIYLFQNQNLSTTFTADEMFAGSGVPTNGTGSSYSGTATHVDAAQTLTITSPLSSGYTLAVFVTYTLNYTAGASATKGDQCSKKFLGFIGTNCTNGYKYTYAPNNTGTVTTTIVSCVPYVIKSTAPDHVIEAAEITTGASGFVPYLYSGLTSNDIVTLPPLADLAAALPKNGFVQMEGESAEDFEIRKKSYDSILYPIGYYQADTLEEALNLKKENNQVTFPLKNFTKDITIWVDWITDNPKNTVSSKDLNTTLEGSTSGTFNPYVSESSPNDLTYDVSYANNMFYLSSDIKSGIVLNFNLNNGKYCYKADKTDSPDESNNENTAATTNYADNTRDYTVVLQNDVNIAGTMRLGGHTGTRSNATTHGQGIIIGNYVALDLNGHTLVIDGKLHSFGLIYDSVGTGKIIVNPGGELYTQMAVYGLHGGQHTLKSYDMGFCPFLEYNFPYLQTDVEVVVENNRAGAFYGYSLFNLGSIGFSNVYMKLFGNSTTASNIDNTTSTALFNMTGTGTARFSYASIDKISANATLKLHMLDIKNMFTFENLDVEFVGISLTIKAMGQNGNLQFQRMYFPISPMLDISFRSSNVIWRQKCVVMPGSTVTFDRDSTLNMTYYKDSNGNAAKQTFSAIGLYVKQDTGYLSGGFYVATYNLSNVNANEKVNTRVAGLCMNNGLTGSTVFWTYFTSGIVNIYGTITFEAGNSSEEPYMLAGNVNISNFKSSSGEILPWSTEHLKAGNFANVNIKTYGAYMYAATSETGSLGFDHVAKVNYYNTSTLISFGKAYLLDTTNTTLTTAKEGSYDWKDGIFRSTDGANYVILCSSTLNKENRLNFSTSVISVTDCGNEIVLDSSGKYYVYFAGTYHSTTLTTHSVTAIDAGVADLNKFASNNYSVALAWNATSKYWYRTA